MVNDSINWYDTETTGKNTRYDQPIQIGVVRTDCDLNPTDEFQIRCCLVERLTTNDEVPWMTFSKALAEIAALRGTCQPEKIYLLDEYQAYLMGTFGRSDNKVST